MPLLLLNHPSLPCSDPCTAAAGVNELSKEEDIKLYPNPANDQLNIQTNDALYNNIIVINVMGQKLIEQPITTKNMSVNITDLPGSTYLVVLKGNNTHYTKVITVAK